MRQEKDKREKENMGKNRRERNQRLRKLLYESFSKIKPCADGDSMRNK